MHTAINGWEDSVLCPDRCLGQYFRAAADQHDAARRLALLEQLLAVPATALRPSLERAARLVSDALGADKVDIFLHDAGQEALVAIGVSDTPLARRERQLGLDVLPVGGPA